MSRFSVLARVLRHPVRAPLAAALVLVSGCSVQVPAAAVPAMVQAPPHRTPPRPASGPTDGGIAGCFSRQLGGAPWAARTAAATVQIYSPGMTGDSDKTGTGFVVRHSGVPGHPRNRILTAGHVPDNMIRGGGILEIASARGIRIGYADLVVRPASWTEAGPLGLTLTRGDIAVIEMRGFVPGGEAEFDSIEGIDIAPAQAAGALAGSFNSPAGIAPGASGAPVLNPAGDAIGALASSVTDSKELDGDAMWSARVNVNGGDGLWNGSWLARPDTDRKVALPSHSLSFAEPVADPRVLAELGAAGQAASARGAPRLDHPVEATIPGFPAHICVVYRGEIGPGGTAVRG